MFKDEVSKDTLKKRREYYLKHGVKNVFPSGLLESSSLDITTPYMLRNDGELLKCGDIHPYIKSYRKESLEETLKYLDLHKSFLEWFYDNSLNEETKLLIKNFDKTEKTIERLWYLTNQEFCRVRTSNYRYKTGGDNGEIYFRISSENFNWFDLIWNTCVKYSPSIDYITIMKDPQVFGKQFDYIKIKGESMNKYPLKNFIELEGEPLAESLLLEDLPKEIKQKIYGKEYIDLRGLVLFYEFWEFNIYDIFNYNLGIDIYKASFVKADKKKFLDLIKTSSLPIGSIVSGEYKETFIILIKDYNDWIQIISIDPNKIKKIWENHSSIDEYFKPLNINSSEELEKDCISGIFLDKLDNVSFFVCDGLKYKKNFSYNGRNLLIKEFKKLLQNNNIYLNKIHKSIYDIFNIEYLSNVASNLYVPENLKDRYNKWASYRLGNSSYIVYDNEKALYDLNNLRKKLSNAKKEFKLKNSKENKENLLKLEQEVKIANDKYLDFTRDKDYYVSYFDSIGCYFILKAFINEIKKLNSSVNTKWEKNDENNSIKSDLQKYIDNLKKFKDKFKDNNFDSLLSSIPEWRSIDTQINDVLSDSLKKAQELADRIKDNNTTDTEYNVLRFVVNLVENFKYKLETILKLAQSIKEDLNEDLNMNEDIEKHDTLNPLLFDENDELKLEIKEAIEKIVNQFVEDLKTDGVKIEVRDIILVGSNVSYNYTKDSDLDIHIIVDKDTLDCDPELYTLLYGAYRSLFNKNYDITIKGIPVEIYVELY